MVFVRYLFYGGKIWYETRDIWRSSKIYKDIKNWADLYPPELLGFGIHDKVWSSYNEAVQLASNLHSYSKSLFFYLYFVSKILHVNETTGGLEFRDQPEVLYEKIVKLNGVENFF